VCSVAKPPYSLDVRHIGSDSSITPFAVGVAFAQRIEDGPAENAVPLAAMSIGVPAGSCAARFCTSTGRLFGGVSPSQGSPSRAQPWRERHARIAPSRMEYHPALRERSACRMSRAPSAMAFAGHSWNGGSPAQVVAADLLLNNARFDHP